MTRRILLICTAFVAIAGCDKSENVKAGEPFKVTCAPQHPDSCVKQCATGNLSIKVFDENHPCNLSFPGGNFYRLFIGAIEIGENIKITPYSVFRMYSIGSDITVTNNIHSAVCAEGTFEFETTNTRMTIFARKGSCIIIPHSKIPFSLTEGQTATLN